MKFIFDLLWKERGSSVSYVAFLGNRQLNMLRSMTLGLLR
jgi:hypothetical protein